MGNNPCCCSNDPKANEMLDLSAVESLAAAWMEEDVGLQESAEIATPAAVAAAKEPPGKYCSYSMESRISLIIRTSSGFETTIRVPAARTTLGGLRQLIQQVVGETRSLNLCLGTKVLSNDSAKLSDLGIVDKTVLKIAYDGDVTEKSSLTDTKHDEAVEIDTPVSRFESEAKANEHVASIGKHVHDSGQRHKHSEKACDWDLTKDSKSVATKHKEAVGIAAPIFKTESETKANEHEANAGQHVYDSERPHVEIVEVPKPACLLESTPDGQPEGEMRERPRRSNLVEDNPSEKACVGDLTEKSSFAATKLNEDVGIAAPLFKAESETTENEHEAALDVGFSSSDCDDYDYDLDEANTWKHVHNSEQPHSEVPEESPRLAENVAGRLDEIPPDGRLEDRVGENPRRSNIVEDQTREDTYGKENEHQLYTVSLAAEPQATSRNYEVSTPNVAHVIEEPPRETTEDAPGLIANEGHNDDATEERQPNSLHRGEDDASESSSDDSFEQSLEQTHSDADNRGVGSLLGPRHGTI